MTVAELVIVVEEEAFAAVSEQLAAELALPLYRPEALPDDAPTYCLIYSAAGLRLAQSRTRADSALFIDFDTTDMRRRLQESLQRQGLGKAVGLKPGFRPRILDATAGLGKDAVLLASQGCSVTLMERSPAIHALLRDALFRAARIDRLQPIVARMRLQFGDFLQRPATDEQFDVVYLDPMFPATSKTARVKKSMQALQEYLGENAQDTLTDAADAHQLLSKARSLARKRVVVKRAKLSGQLAASAPDICFRGKSNRFDVYLQHG